MDISNVVSVKKFKEFDVAQKEELYETLLSLSNAVDEIPKKSLRKILEVTLAVLEYKGEQIERQNGQRTAFSSENVQNERILIENEKLKNMLERMEDEKSVHKNKIKNLTDEIFQLQKRLQDAANLAEVSDKDSSDPLSELDKQEELLRNINTKNKHIKRLLKEIEMLQNQNIEQSKIIIRAETDLQRAKSEVFQLSSDITVVDNDRKSLEQTVKELNNEITRLEGKLTYLEEEHEKNDKAKRVLMEKLEAKVNSLKQNLKEKDAELKKMQTILEQEGLARDLLEQSGDTPGDNSTQSKHDDDNSIKETTKMLHTIEMRDKQIEQLELKIKTMAKEMLASTKLMNRLTVEKEEERDPQKSRACCKMLEESLQSANDRCRELSDILERSEEDNMLKSKQAMQAITALDAYQRGEDGLVKALKKCASLEQKILSRDKQIRALVMELNSMHEIAHENGLLRKRLNIPDDVVISAKNLAAKERNKDKIIDRLTLKLRASEEMRLQLKLEKSELRQQILKLQQDAIKPNPNETYTIIEKEPSEAGEVEDSICTQFFETQPNTTIPELHTKYQEVLEENEMLRLGMHDILEKLREYDATSDHITIDVDILTRLLKVLETHSAGNTPKHSQSHVQQLNERKEAIQKLLASNGYQDESSERDEISSIQNARDDKDSSIRDILPLQMPKVTDSSTRPTTPTQSIDRSTIPIIMETSSNVTLPPDVQACLRELQIYKKYYEELQLHMAASDTELTSYCAELVDQKKSLEMDLLKINSSYTFMREEFDSMLSSAKQSEMQYIQSLSDLKKELHEHQQVAQRLEYDCMEYKKNYPFNDDEFIVLQKSKAELQSQLAYITEQLLSGSLMEETKITDICADYGVIKDNFQLDFITLEEYQQHRNDYASAIEKRDELAREVKQLEGLLEIAQEQIQSQQRLINEITDNHINLRHLVADLQSTSEGNFILAKTQRDLDNVKSEMVNLKMERDELKHQLMNLQNELTAKIQMNNKIQKEFQDERRNKEIKLKFLQKSLFTLKEKYPKFTPLIFLTNFVFAYTRFVKSSTAPSIDTSNDDLIVNLSESILTKLKDNKYITDESQNLIKLIKTETQYKLLEEKFNVLQVKNKNLEQELTEQRIRAANDSEHWQTIQALFGPSTTDTPAMSATAEEEKDEKKNIEKKDLKPKLASVGINTDTELSQPASDEKDRPSEEVVEKTKHTITPSRNNIEEIPKQTIATQTTAGESTSSIQSRDGSPRSVGMARCITIDTEVQTCHGNVEHQGVQTAQIKSDESNLTLKLREAQQNTKDMEDNLAKCQEQLNAANKLIKELQEQLNAQSSRTSPRAGKASESDVAQGNAFIEKTILSLHTLLTEKDKSISKYQDMLQDERQQSQSVTNKLNADIDGLKNTVTNLNFNIKTKDMEIMELKTKLETLSVRRNSNEKIDLAAEPICADEGGDNSLNELTDEKLEEMFQQDTLTVTTVNNNVTQITMSKGSDNMEKQDVETLKERPTLLLQMKNLKDKITYWENTLKVKEEEISLLKEKLHLYQEREKSVDNSSNPEIDQLRSMLDEKDKHINDLMETLNNFHDDQQRYIKDSSDYSADQITKLAASLTRTEATNKIYQTQMEALRRQVASLTQREKQARELNQSLRNQLIKRPVVSIKTELNARVKSENLQKRIQQLELELEEARSEIHRQQIVIDAKRARSANEVGLWEKQKRWQQNAEKFKSKLEETETTLEKTRTLLQTARNNISRLEKDKQILENKLSRAGHATVPTKCCRVPSCPNLRQHMGNKFIPSESPDTYTGASSTSSSPAHSSSLPASRLSMKNSQCCSGILTSSSHNAELIEALKARIELQQRKILAMEFERKGSNTLSTEVENLQDKYSTIEAQNIRLEAKNLQLQLDNDLLRQGDGTERLHKRIKHLEDYIIALKEEMAHAEVRRDICKCSGIKLNTQQGQSAEQTILSLRRIVEKLRAENKYLKDGRRSCESRSSTETPTELNKYKQLYTESLEKITSLQTQLKAKCTSCSSHIKAETQALEEIKLIKEQLVKKTQLLQKAKVLLTRSAAKEKVLKEQLTMWKRKCSELQNVPVIEEISE